LATANRDPHDTEGLIAVLPLEDCAVSTWDDCKRCHERTGVLHRLVDPSAGNDPRAADLQNRSRAQRPEHQGPGTDSVRIRLSAGLALVARVPGTDTALVAAEGRLRV
jgi:thiamine biosynthesis lipoprotein